jgi:hypothetical protein
MKQLQEIEKTGNAAVRKLRINKLKKGHPFMINSKDLPLECKNYQGHC